MFFDSLVMDRHATPSAKEIWDSMEPEGGAPPTASPVAARDPPRNLCALNRFLIMCKEIHNVFTLDTVETAISLFVTRYRGHCLPCDWPPGYECRVGNFYSASEWQRLMGHLSEFPCISMHAWIIYFGRFGKRCGADYHTYLERMDLLITPMKELYGYIQSEDSLHYLTSDMSRFFSYGPRYICVFNSVPSVSHFEKAWYGHNLTPKQMWILQHDWQPVKVIEHLEAGNVVFERESSKHSITLGTESNINVRDHVPDVLLNVIKNAGLVFVGVMSFCHRFLFLDMRNGNVFTIVYGNQLFKVADNLRGLIRAGCYPVARGNPVTSYGINARRYKLAIGERIPLRCPVKATLPGDIELLESWHDNWAYVPEECPKLLYNVLDRFL